MQYKYYERRVYRVVIDRSTYSRETQKPVFGKGQGQSLLFKAPGVSDEGLYPDDESTEELLS